MIFDMLWYVRHMFIFIYMFDVFKELLLLLFMLVRFGRDISFATKATHGAFLQQQIINRKRFASLADPGNKLRSVSVGKPRWNHM